MTTSYKILKSRITQTQMTLDLSGRELTELDYEVVQYQMKLICKNNRLTTMPILTNLTTLDCGNNELTALPLLPNLRNLWCRGNRLTSIPLLQNLEILYCEDNQLSTLPLLTNLTDLHCGFNKLIILPHLPNLRVLYCCSNELTTLSNLPNLRVLYYANNPFTTVLTTLVLDFPSLTELAVERLPPSIIVNQEIYPIVADLQQSISACHECNTHRVLHSKVYICGKFNVPISAMLCRGCYGKV